MALVKETIATKVNVNPETIKKETKTPDVKLVKKEAGIYDEAGSFTSNLVTLETFYARCKENILADCFKIISLSLDNREKDFLFTSVEKKYLENALQEFYKHAKQEMVSSQSRKVSTSEYVQVLLQEKRFKEAQELIENMGNIEEIETIEITPLSFKEAKKMILDNIQVLSDFLLETLKEISLYK